MWVTIDTYKTGINLKELFKKHDYTVKEIAYELKVHPKTVYRWCCGDKIPAYENIVGLSIILGEPIENIVVFHVRY